MVSDPHHSSGKTEDFSFTSRILDSLTDPVFYQDAMGTYQGCNNAFVEKIMGLSNSGRVGKSLANLQGMIPLELNTHDPQEDDELLATPGKILYECKIKCPDGEERYYSISKSTIVDSENNITGMVGLMTDISKQKCQERALMQEQKRFEKMYQKTPAMLHSIDPNGIITAVSDLWLEKMGYHRQEVIGLDMATFLSQTSRKKAKTILEHFSKTGHTRDIEIEYVRKDGGIFDVLLSTSTEFNKQGECVRSLAFSIDNREKKKAEKLLNQVPQNLEEIALDRTVELKELNSELESRIKENDAMRALLESRNSAIEASIDGIIITDATLPDNPIIYVNSGFTRLTGYSTEEVIGNNCRFLQGKFTSKETKQAINRAIKERKSFTGEILNYQKNGNEFWNLLRIQPYFNNQSELVNFVGIQTDITKIKEAEDNLRDSEARFSIAIQEAPYPIMIHDENGRILMTNRAWKKISGYSSDHFPNLGMWLDNAFAQNAEDMKRMEKHLDSALSSGKPVHLADTMILTSVGKKRFWDIALCPLGKMSGRNRTLMITANDITETKRIELSNLEAHHSLEEKVRERTSQLAEINRALKEEIREKKAVEYKLLELKEAVEQSPASVVITNTDGYIEYVNPAFESITGYSSEEAIGQHTRLLKSGNLPTSFYLDLWEKITSGLDWQGEFENRKKCGETFWELATISPVTDENGIIQRFVAVKEDITERKKKEAEIVEANKELELINKALKEAVQKAEKLAQKADMANRAKSEFLANISHEIRTPMNAILGFSDLLSKELTQNIQQRYLRTIQVAAKSLLGLIRDILDLSSIESGKMRIHKETVDIRKIASEIHQIFALPATQKGILYTSKMDEKIPGLILSDEIRIRQILINLVGNAVKFTHKGVVKLTFRAENIRKKSNTLTIKLIIEDTGIGIVGEEKQRIFEPFEQQSGQKSKKYGGTGLGLAITKRLVEIMGGKIKVTGRLKKGSTFTVTLPGITVENWTSSNLGKLVTDSQIKEKNKTFPEVDHRNSTGPSDESTLNTLPPLRIKKNKHKSPKLSVSRATNDLLRLKLRKLFHQAGQQRDVELIYELLSKLENTQDLQNHAPMTEFVKRYREATELFDISTISQIEESYIHFLNSLDVVSQENPDS